MTRPSKTPSSISDGTAPGPILTADALSTAARRVPANAAAQNGNLTKLAQIVRRAPKTLGGPCHQPKGLTIPHSGRFARGPANLRLQASLNMNGESGATPPTASQDPAAAHHYCFPMRAAHRRRGQDAALASVLSPFAATDAATPILQSALDIAVCLVLYCLGP